MTDLNNDFPLGQPIDLDANFTNRAGVLFDPSAVRFLVEDSGGTQATYTYNTDAEVSRVSVGLFRCRVVGDRPGRWFYRVETDDQGIADNGQFWVRTSRFSA